MARIAGVNIPQNKLVKIGLTYIYGIGNKFSKDICKELNIPTQKRVNNLTDEEVLKISEHINKKYSVGLKKGFETDDDEAQKRFISVTLKKGKNKIHILNGYFPQGEEREHPIKFPYKVKFYKDLIIHFSLKDLY